MARILIIDDEDNIRKTLREILEDDAYTVDQAADGAEGVKRFFEDPPDVVLLDIQMPKKDGMTVLKEIKASKNNAEVIMITGHGTVESAVQAIKLGAYHFLQKPLSLHEVRQNVKHAVQAKLQRDELKGFRESKEQKFKMIGKGESMARLKKEIAKVAPTGGRVMITGESGTGKELVAYAIHQQSDRRNKPFIKLNCAAIPDNLIESELFGHERGAFTGATARKKGKFELAHGGTLFLDEIGDMNLSTQTKVLRAIQEGEFERVGGEKTLRVDVRIVAATHRNLEASISAGTFREDLFYRLNVVPLRVPRLCDRPEDIPLLARHFLKAFAAENNNPEKQFSDEALDILSTAKFTGNIRELRNVVERAAIMSEDSIISAAFVRTLISPGEEGGSGGEFIQPLPLSEAKDLLEKRYVEAQLDRNGWNIPQTAEVLKIQRTNLHRKIKQLNIKRKQRQK